MRVNLLPPDLRPAGVLLGPVDAACREGLMPWNARCRGIGVNGRFASGRGQRIESNPSAAPSRLDQLLAQEPGYSTLTSGRTGVHVSAAGLPGSGLPMSATGIQKLAWPIAIVSVASAFGS